MNDEKVRERALFVYNKVVAPTGVAIKGMASEIGRRMAESIYADSWEQLAEADRSYKAKKTTQKLKRMLGIEVARKGLLHTKTPWTTEMARAFEKTMGLPSGYLDGESRLHDKITELSWGPIFESVMAQSQLEDAQIRELRDQLYVTTQSPELFDLVHDVTEAILENEDRERAAGAVSKIILEAPAALFKRPDRRSSRTTKKGTRRKP